VHKRLTLENLTTEDDYVILHAFWITVSVTESKIHCITRFKLPLSFRTEIVQTDKHIKEIHE
jgi:hypothetical protein